MRISFEKRVFLMKFLLHLCLTEKALQLLF